MTKAIRNAYMEREIFFISLRSAGLFEREREILIERLARRRRGTFVR